MNNFLKKIFCTVLMLAVFVLPAFAAAQSGQEEDFYADQSYDLKGRSEVSSVLVKESEHAYFYLDKDFWAGLDSERDVQVSGAIADLAEEFDETIYPNLTSFWGSEWKPGIDGDSKITVLIAQMEKGVGGYFRPRDEYPREEKETSNEREILYLSTKYLGHPRLKSFLAHEFQHLITFNQKDRLRGFSEDVWLNDIRSEYSPTYLGYDDEYETSNLKYRISDFTSDPHNAFTEWFNKSSDYGVVNLFSQYVADHYGENVLKRTMVQNMSGIENLNQAFLKEGYEKSFVDVFEDWTLASYINDPDFQKGLYSYKTPDYLSKVKIDPTESFQLAAPQSKLSFTQPIKEWSPRWYKFEPENSRTDPYTLQFEIAHETERGNPEAYLVSFKEGEPKKMTEFNFSQAKASLGVADFGGDVDKLLLVLFNEYNGSYKPGSLPEEAVSEFQVEVSSLENVMKIDSVSPKYALNKKQKIEIRGDNLDLVEKVRLGGEEIEDFEKKKTSRLVFPIDGFDSAGKKNLTLVSSKTKDILAPGAIELFEPISEGALVKAPVSPKVYVIKDGFKRHILKPEVFSFYPQLEPDKIEKVATPRLSLYEESFLIRQDGKEKVYKVETGGTKHWLDISADQFAESGRKWGAVYIVNSLEGNFYKEGEAIVAE